jgi:cation diffusion facilitator CzcD-associated flavoprotein CzcO
MTATLATAAASPQTAVQPDAHLDVLIVGAGISGFGAAYHLKHQCPDKRFAVLEALESYGGTWLMHTYPGIRSDSDLYTFGYRFKPWTGAPIATAAEIQTYLGEVIAENDLARHIHYKHKILSASWSSADKRWTVEVSADGGAPFKITCTFLWMCQGYYRHAKGYTPEWKGMADFKGQIVHPQTWPKDLDYKGKKVLIIGSGATAATLAPALAADAGHVTVLQRSPTYFIPARNANELADQLRALEVDESWIHEITRRRILHDQAEFTRRSFEEPETVTKELLDAARLFLPEETVREHFTPRYRPWRQRIAFIPDGDLFQGIASGKASMVTDEIERFTEKGILLRSGRELEADIVVTATGFNLNVLGDIAFEIDGKPLDFAKTVTYRGMMFTGIPNMLWIFGYFRASWTLRVDLLGDFTCRLLNHMSAHGKSVVEVKVPPEDRDMKLLPWIDEENFNPGYLMRAMHLLPKRGSKPEWAHTQDYWRERKELPAIDLAGKEFVYA